MSCMQMTRFSVRVKNEQEEQASHVKRHRYQQEIQPRRIMVHQARQAHPRHKPKNERKSNIKHERGPKMYECKIYISYEENDMSIYIKKPRLQHCKIQNTKKKKLNTNVWYACARSRLPLQHRDIKTSNKTRKNMFPHEGTHRPSQTASSLRTAQNTRPFTTKRPCSSPHHPLLPHWPIFTRRQLFRSRFFCCTTKIGAATPIGVRLPKRGMHMSCLRCANAKRQNLRRHHPPPMLSFSPIP